MKLWGCLVLLLVVLLITDLCEAGRKGKKGKGGKGKKGRNRGRGGKGGKGGRGGKGGNGGGSDDSGREFCKIGDKGQLKAFSRDRMQVNYPCKFLATEVTCDGYEIKVVPGQNIDSRGNYYVETVYVSIQKVNTDFYWKGRTSTKLVRRYLAGEVPAPFTTAEENMVGAPFATEMNAFARDYKVSLRVNDTSFSVDFYGYVEGKQRQMKKNAVRVLCSNPSFDPDTTYPATLCGNNNDYSAFADRAKQLDIYSHTKAALYDFLGDDTIVQTNPKCETAGNVFRSCDDDKKLNALKECSVLLTNKNIIRCLQRDNMIPMDVFVYCLRFKCNKDFDNCYDLKEALDGCPRVDVAPNGCNHFLPPPPPALP